MHVRAGSRDAGSRLFCCWFGEAARAQASDVASRDECRWNDCQGVCSAKYGGEQRAKPKHPMPCNTVRHGLLRDGRGFPQWCTSELAGVKNERGRKGYYTGSAEDAAGGVMVGSEVASPS